MMHYSTINAYNKGPGTAEIIGRFVRGCSSSTIRLMNVPSRVEEIANKKGVKMAQIALAWSLAKDGQCPLFDY